MNIFDFIGLALQALSIDFSKKDNIEEQNKNANILSILYFVLSFFLLIQLYRITDYWSLKQILWAFIFSLFITIISLFFLNKINFLTSLTYTQIVILVPLSLIFYAELVFLLFRMFF